MAKCFRKTYDGYCAKHSDEVVLEFCVEGPCTDETPAGATEGETMKPIRICYEVQGMGVNEDGQPIPAGMQVSFGEVSDEAYAKVDYFRALEEISAIDLLKQLGMSHLAEIYHESDFRLISPDEYDEKYGEART